METRKRRSQRRRKTQKGGARSRPVTRRRYRPLRQKIVDYPGFRLKSKRRTKKVGGLDVAKFFPNTIVHRREEKELEHSTQVIKSLLKVYGKTENDDQLDDIYEFLVFLNSAVRKTAAENEADVRIYIADDLANKITDTDHIEFDDIEEKSKECIAFLKKLSSKFKKTKNAVDIKELLELIDMFNTAIKDAIKDHEQMQKDLMQELQSPAANVEMADEAENDQEDENDQEEETAPASKNVDDLLSAFKGLGF